MDELTAVRASMSRARLRSGCGEPTVSAVAVVRPAHTGARPLLLACDDGRRYWAKGPENPHGNLSLVHEWVISELSRLMHGPLPRGVLLDLHADLLGEHRVDGKCRVPGIWFGCELVRGEEAQVIRDASRDGNPQRIPRYLALWHLCVGLDAQFIYEREAEDRLWSIDHGLWFDNGASNWNEAGGLGPLLNQVWDEPDWRGSRMLDPDACADAASTVEQLAPEVIGEVMASVPVQWGIPDPDLEDLALFILGRRRMAEAAVRARANRR